MCTTKFEFNVEYLFSLQVSFTLCSNTTTIKRIEVSCIYIILVKAIYL